MLFLRTSVDNDFFSSTLCLMNCLWFLLSTKLTLFSIIFFLAIYNKKIIMKSCRLKGLLDKWTETHSITHIVLYIYSTTTIHKHDDDDACSELCENQCGVGGLSFPHSLMLSFITQYTNSIFFLLFNIGPFAFHFFLTTFGFMYVHIHFEKHTNNAADGLNERNIKNDSNTGYKENWKKGWREKCASRQYIKDRN